MKLHRTLHYTGHIKWFWGNPSLQHIFQQCWKIKASVYLKTATTFDLQVEADCLQCKRQTESSRLSCLKKLKIILLHFTYRTCIIQNWSVYKIKQIPKRIEKKLPRSKPHFNKHSQNSWLITLSKHAINGSPNKHLYLYD